MDKLTFYRSCVRELINSYEGQAPINGEIEVHLIEDIARDRYQVCNIGWIDKARVHGCTLHIDIKDEKIWIQQNLTEDLVATELVEKGVPKHDIVLGFQSAFKRQFTDYAVE